MTSLPPHTRLCTTTPVLDNVLLTCAVVSMLAGITISTFVDQFAGSGYVCAAIPTALLAHSLRKLRLSKSLCDAAEALSCENGELKENNSVLSASVEALNHEIHQFASQNLNLTNAAADLANDIDMLKGTIGAVGVAGDDIVKRLRSVWRKYNDENERHAHLVQAQARLQLVQIMQHYDANVDAELSQSELDAATAYIKATFPDADMDKLMARAKANAVTFDDMIECLL